MNVPGQADFISGKGRVLPLSERVDPRSTALVVVDVQNDFCDPNGAFGKLGADVSMMPAMAASLQQLIDAARRRSMLIIWVRATYDAIVTSDALAETYNRRGFLQSQCLDGSWGADWYRVAPDIAPNEVVVAKHRFSPFWDTAIDLYLRSNGIRSVVVTGVVTSGCVDSTVRDAFFNDYYVVVAEDCVAEASHERHVNALNKLAQAFGVVVPAADIISRWDDAAHNALSWQVAAKQASQLRDRKARLDPAHTALILVDVPHRLPAAGEMADLTQLHAAIPRIAALLRGARANQVMVIHVTTLHGEADASDVSLFVAERSGAWQQASPGTPDPQNTSGFTANPGETVVVKHRYSSFADTGLGKLLRANRIRTLVVAGMETQCAVECTVRDGTMRDFYVVVPGDCVATRDSMQRLHDASLETMGRYFADIFPAAEIVGNWQAGSPPG